MSKDDIVLNIKWQPRLKNNDIIKTGAIKHQHRAENDREETELLRSNMPDVR